MSADHRTARELNLGIKVISKATLAREVSIAYSHWNNKSKATILHSTELNVSVKVT